MIPEVVIWMGMLKMLTHLWSEDSHGTHHAENCLFHRDWVFVVRVTRPGVHLTFLAIIWPATIWISLRQLVAPDMHQKICVGLKLPIALEAMWRWNFILIESHHVGKVKIVVVSEYISISFPVIIWREAVHTWLLAKISSTYNVPPSLWCNIW